MDPEYNENLTCKKSGRIAKRKYGILVISADKKVPWTSYVELYHLGREVDVSSGTYLRWNPEQIKLEAKFPVDSILKNSYTPKHNWIYPNPVLKSKLCQ